MKFVQQCVETLVQFISHQQLTAEDRSTRRGCSLDVESFYIFNMACKYSFYMTLAKSFLKILLKRFSNEREKLVDCLKF